jgi:hypothetical protein
MIKFKKKQVANLGNRFQWRQLKTRLAFEPRSTEPEFEKITHGIVPHQMER